MARKVGFHIYTLRVKKKYQRTFETLSSVDGLFDVQNVLAKGLRATLQNHRTDPATERIQCMKKVDSTNRVITGLFNAGHYGEAADIVDSVSTAVSYEKKQTDAEMIPCFFRLEIPTDKDEAILILQRDNRVSCKSAFSSIVAPLIVAQNSELTVHITPLMSKQVFEKLIKEGEVQRLRFIKMSIPEDFVESYDKGHKETEGSVELIVKARRGFSLPFRSIISSWSKSSKTVPEMYELRNFDFDTVKADVRIGKSVQTVDFGKRFNQPILDLTNAVKFLRASRRMLALLPRRKRWQASKWLRSTTSRQRTTT